MRAGKITAVFTAAAFVLPMSVHGSQEEKPYRVVGYLPDWSYQAYSELDPADLAHINIAFCNPDDSGRLYCNIPDRELESIVSSAHEKGTEVFAALGGGGGCDNYLRFIDEPAKMEQFSDNIMSYCERYDLDGIDLDIELSSYDRIWDYYGDWCIRLRELCDERDMEMSTATAQWVAEKVSPETFALFDFVNVMAYDNDEDSHSHAAYDYSVKCLDYFSTVKKIPSEKLVLGVPFYGRGYTSEGELDWNSYRSFADLLKDDADNYSRDSYNGYAYNYSYDLINDLYEITADWHHTFDKHNVGVIVGYNYEKTRYEWFDESNRNFPTDSYTYHKIETGKGLQNGAATMSSYKQEDTLIGLFGRVTYNYDDRYLLMASLRREGSSKFGADHKWGTFPGVSAGWRINNEKFMKGVKWVDNLKLRVGYGVTGININDPYQSLASLNYTNYFLYDGQWISTLVPARNANPDLRWEKKIEYNLGIDFELFKGRLGGAIDLYQRDTKDGLWNYTVPVPPYQYSTIMANVAKIRNSGIEILVNFVPVRTKDFEWRGNISYSHNKNEVRSISNDQFTMSTDYFYTGHTGEPIQTSTHRVKVGEPLGQFFGLKSVGLDESGKWVVERLKHDDPNDPEKVTGTYYGLAEDANDADKQVLGNGIAKHFLNFNNTLTYKGFDLSINMRGQFGFQILNFQEMYYANPTIQYNVLNSAFDMHPVVSVSEDGSSISYTGKQTRIADAQRYVSEYVENGSFWKIDNLTLGYTFNTSKWKIVRNLRVYASCLNLLTITSYKGLDPEMSFRGDETGGYALAFGTDHRDKFPTIRSYTFGINVTF